MLLLTLANFFLHNSTLLNVSQYFHCVKTNSVLKTRSYRKFRRFSAFIVIFAEKGMRLLMSGNLVLHSSLRLHFSECLHCVKTNNELKTRF